MFEVDLSKEEIERLRVEFEKLNRDSMKFSRSRKGTYTNPAIARDWKWFQLGALINKNLRNK